MQDAKLGQKYYRQLRQCGYRADHALAMARTLVRWDQAESAGHVRLVAKPESESYWDVYGEPDSERERKAQAWYLEHWGCWCVVGQYYDGQAWQWADSVGMCVYEHPLSPFENCYVPDIMAATLDQYEAMAFFQDATVTA